MSATFERRVHPLRDVQIRAADDDSGRMRFRGRAIVYNRVSENLGVPGFEWREVIRPGSATNTLSRTPDVRFLYNHDPSKLLGRTASGTLTLTEDDEGVVADADMADVSYARDVAALLERGDLTQMSFGFWMVDYSWSADLLEVREIELDGGDVSVVTFPAYAETSAELRSRAPRSVPDGATDDESRSRYSRTRARNRLRALEAHSQL